MDKKYFVGRIQQKEGNPMKKLIGFMLILQILFCVGISAGYDETVDINTLDYIDAVQLIAKQELEGKADNLVVSKSNFRGKVIKVEYVSTEPIWDSTDFVRTAFSHYVDICKEAYVHKDAIEIYFNVKAVVNDSTGWPETKTLIYLLMSIDKFNTYDWDNLPNKKLDFKAVSKDCKIFNLMQPLSFDFDVNNFYYIGK